MKIAVRGWPEPKPMTYKASEFKLHTVRRRLLVIDTETTSDQYQRLTFGSAQAVYLGAKDILRNPKLQEEVLFYADDLPESNPDGYRSLVDYCAERKLRLISQHEFCIKYLNRCTDYGPPGKTVPSYFQAVFFNLPFDVSRLAYGYGKPRGGSYQDGFAFRMFKSGDPVSPTFTVRSLDSRKSFIKGFNALDVRTLVASLTDRSMSLASAGKAFGVPEEYLKGHAERYDVITPEFIDYNRQDVTATAYLAAAAISEYHKNPVARKPQEVYSSASLGKSYLEAIGITPMLSRDVPKGNLELGNMGSTFFGGRSECRLRRVSAPVNVLDFQSMYPTVNALMGLWQYVIAESVAKVEYTEQAREFFDGLTLEKVLDRATWPELTGFALVKPNGDVLPVRGEYENQNGDGSRTLTVGVNELYSDVPLWYSFPDLVASKLLTGKTPEILRAYRLTPGQPIKGLRNIKIPGVTEVIDPYRDDFFQKVVEYRAEIKAAHKKPKGKDCVCANCTIQTGLKCLSNGTSYGVYAEITREDLAEVADQTIYGAFDDGWTYHGRAYEKPGKYSYMPIAALITAAARLMLATLERMVTDLGGSYVFTDTDSMAVMAGGPSPVEGIRSLEAEEVEEIRNRINSLNPYHGEAGKQLLKNEHSCYAFAISAKRYTLHTYDDDGRPVIPENIDGDRAYKEHALGMYLNPGYVESANRDWMREAWQYILDKEHGITAYAPDWAGKPALIRNAVTRPAIMDQFRDINGGRAYGETGDYPDRIKPFSFLLMASEWRAGKSETPPRRIITGYSRFPEEWINKDWYDLHNPDSPPLRIGRDLEVKTMNMVLLEYRYHPETKSLGPDSKECRYETKGLLKRRTIKVTDVSEVMTVGKESNRVNDQVSHMIEAPEEVYSYYGMPDGTTPGETQWCKCGCGKPVAEGKDYLNRSHYEKQRRTRSRNVYEATDDDMGDWLECLREMTTEAASPIPS